MSPSFEPIGSVRAGRVEPARDGAEALAELDAVSHVEVRFHFHSYADEPAELGARHPLDCADRTHVGIFAQRALTFGYR